MRQAVRYGVHINTADDLYFSHPLPLTMCGINAAVTLGKEPVSSMDKENGNGTTSQQLTQSLDIIKHRSRDARSQVTTSAFVRAN